MSKVCLREGLNKSLKKNDCPFHQEKDLRFSFQAETWHNAAISVKHSQLEEEARASNKCSYYHPGIGKSVLCPWLSDGMSCFVAAVK